MTRRIVQRGLLGAPEVVLAVGDPASGPAEPPPGHPSETGGCPADVPGRAPQRRPANDQPPRPTRRPGGNSPDARAEPACRGGGQAPARHPGRLLKVKEVAARIGVSTRTVQTWIGTGRLTPIRLSRRVLRIDEEEVEAWIRQATAS